MANSSRSPAGAIPGGLSVSLIARDEERDLGEALDSVGGIADEIIVLVDERSRDRTEEIARGRGARVSLRRFDTFAGQKQAALDLCGSRWVLSLDADERLSPALRGEILRGLNGETRFAGFDIPFHIHFMGRRLRFGGLGSESHLRLFRRDSARFTGGRLHEGLEVSGPVARLTHPIIHQSYRDLADYLRKLDLYTSLGAQKLKASGRRFRPWHHLVLPWEFFSRAVLRLGLLDGHAGLIWAALSAYHAWLKYAKLKELE
ncbi:MAG: glycosyltransferase family 2 protein [Elusimicrobia bacterium]|nr:glycosyltransferase family 2 protein [Elusimicrobiota bacterium]